MATLERTRIPIPLRRRAQRLTSIWGPIAVWAIALGTCTVLYRSDAEDYSAKGLFLVRESVVSPAIEGGLASIAVKPFQTVRVGQVVATMDDTVLKAEIAAMETEVKEATAELAAKRFEAENMRQERALSDQIHVRRFQVDLDSAQLTELNRRLDLEAAHLEFMRRTIDEDHQQQLVLTGVNDKSVLEELKLRTESAKETLAQSEAGVQLAVAQVDAARKRVAEYEPGPSRSDEVDVLVAPLARKVEVIVARVDMLKARVPGLVLRSPLDGVVRETLAMPGDNLQAGAPIMRIDAPQPDQLLAYVPPDAAVQPRVGGKVRIRRVSGHDSLEGSGVVQAVGPAITPLPLRLQRTPQSVDHGLPIQIAVEKGIFLPGEAVTVIFGR